MASYAKTQRDKLRLAQLYAPAGLLLLTVMLCFGAWLPWRHHRQSPAESAPPDLVDVRDTHVEEREPAGV